MTYDPFEENIFSTQLQIICLIDTPYSRYFVTLYLLKIELQINEHMSISCCCLCKYFIDYLLLDTSEVGGII